MQNITDALQVTKVSDQNYQTAFSVKVVNLVLVLYRKSESDDVD